jgi:Flp pilus assembly protein TadD
MFASSALVALLLAAPARPAGGAEAQLLRAIATNPGDGAAWNALGLQRHARENWADAADAFRHAAKLLPADAHVHVNLGASLLAMGQSAEARAELERAASLDASYAKPHLLLGRLDVLDGRAADAERELRQAADLAKEDPVARYQLGLLLLQQRRLDEAIASLSGALKLDANMASAHLNLGLALQRSGKAAEAHEHLARFRALSEATAKTAQDQLRLTGALAAARKALDEGRPDAVLAPAQDAIALAPGSPAPHAMLAAALQALGRTDDAARERDLAAKLEHAPR